jgi:3D (Asp-Asp-Asp) domain-containing protein
LSVLAAVAALAFSMVSQPCEPVGEYRITGYVRGAPGLSNRTYDGTSVWTDEKIVAASWNVPLDTLLRVSGLDFTYRVADRGQLGNRGWIDVLVDTEWEAYHIEEWVGGKYAPVCVVRWGR